jgi:hypothetical protein
MQVYRPAPRLVGVLLLAASGISTLVHRAVYQATRQGPPQLAELGLGLLTFMLASAGILLVIHGARLWHRDEADPNVPEKTQTTDLESLLLGQVTPAGQAFDTRRGASLMKAVHVSAASTPLASRRQIVDRLRRLDDRRRRSTTIPR